MMNRHTGDPETSPVGERDRNRDVFNPAVKPLDRAFWVGDPVPGDLDTAEKWIHARRRVMRHLLLVVSLLPQTDNLVLRGSLLMPAWFGEAAREPGDIDWVILPSSVGVDDDWAQTLFQDIFLACKELIPEAVGLLDESWRMEDIWTYNSAPGKRLVFPWRVDDLPISSVQMDFVFGEVLHTPAESVTIPEPWGDDVSVLGASPEESLAWKILWLTTEDNPPGKDLYDAVLLAESVHLPLDLLRAVVHGKTSWGRPSEIADLNFYDVRWDDFQKQYPGIGGTLEDWIDRLRDAMVPTFATCGEGEGTGESRITLHNEDLESEAQKDFSGEPLTLWHGGVGGPAQYVFALPDGQRRKKSGGDERPRTD